MKTLARGENKVIPLPARLQDTLSFLFQLGHDLRAAKVSGDRLSVVASNARKIYRHEFSQVGEETLQTQIHLPVKVKFYAGRFLIEPTVTSIGVGSR